MIHINKLKKKIIDILKKRDVRHAGLFGSYARGEVTSDSDIDLLIEFKGDKSLFDLVGLKIELEESLGQKVDIVTYRSLHPSLKRHNFV